MALVSCPECSTNVSDRAVSCPSCGCPIAKQPEIAPQPVSQSTAPTHSPSPRPLTVSKSRGTYIIIGLLFGAIGFHNFYSSHYGRGWIKVGLFSLGFALDASTGFRTGFSLVALVLCGLWALVEIVFQKNDAAGNAMA